MAALDALNPRRVRSLLLHALPVLVTAVCLWMPHQRMLVVSMAVVTGIVGLASPRPAKPVGFLLLVAIYGIWVSGSAHVHLEALGALHPEALVTAGFRDAAWAKGVLRYDAGQTLAFPLLLATALLLPPYIVRSTLFVTLPLVFLVSVAVALYQSAVDLDFANQPYFVAMGRASGLATDPNALGLSSFLVLGIALACLPRSGFGGRLARPAVVVGCVAGAVLSGSRTGLGGIVVLLAVIAALLLSAVGNGVGRRATLSVLGGLLVAAAVVATIGVPERIASLASELATRGPTGLVASSGRANLWRQAFRLTTEAPVAGWGPGGVRRQIDNVRFRHGEPPGLIDNANNHYLQASAELGLLGAGLDLVLHLLPLAAGVRRMRNDTDPHARRETGVLAVTLALLLVLFVTGPHTMHTDVAWITALLLAGLRPTGARTRAPGAIALLLAVTTATFFVATSRTAFGERGVASVASAPWWPVVDRGCAGIEELDGRRVRRCHTPATLQIAIVQGTRDVLPLHVRVPASEAPDRVVRLHLPEGGIARIEPGGWRRVEIPVTGLERRRHSGVGPAVAFLLVPLRWSAVDGGEVDLFVELAWF